MMPGHGSAFHAFHLSLLRIASLVAPSRRRAEWWREWRAELWHVRRERVPAGGLCWPAELEITAFCLGAFRDSYCLRRQSPRESQPPASFFGSAAYCLFAMAVVLAAGMIVALRLPGVRAVTGTPLYRLNPHLVQIQRAEPDDDAAPTVPYRTFLNWKARRQRSFDEFAFFSIAYHSVSTGGERPTRWTIAHASANLFSLAGIPLQFALTDPPSDLPSVILGCSAFVRNFGANPQIVGSVLQIGEMNARIAAVLPCRAVALPGRVDAWLVEPSSWEAHNAAGYVVAHLSERGRLEMTSPRIAITAAGAGESQTEFWGDSIEDGEPGPWAIYLFTVFLALLSLPAVTSVSMAESSFSSHKPSLSRRLCRWAFLAGKIALLLALTYFISLDLAYSWFPIDSQWPLNIQLFASFLLSLFGMRWVVLDQRRRCPVCLRRVSNPARVGDASRTFLAWNGTELICTAGHTLLHVPGLPTSWFSAQRWLYLDTSWQFLFAASSES